MENLKEKKLTTFTKALPPSPTVLSGATLVLYSPPEGWITPSKSKSWLRPCPCLPHTKRRAKGFYMISNKYGS